MKGEKESGRTVAVGNRRCRKNNAPEALVSCWALRKGCASCVHETGQQQPVWLECKKNQSRQYWGRQ